MFPRCFSCAPKSVSVVPYKIHSSADVYVVISQRKGGGGKTDKNGRKCVKRGVRAGKTIAQAYNKDKCF